ncbi:MAG: RNA-binding protein [Nitrososphaera sp.]|nr:RNA-binding protein [Nitrososphaera sp.]
MKISTLSNSETADLVERLKTAWPAGSVSRVKSLKKYEIDEAKSLFVSDEISAVKVNDSLVPFLGKTELVQKFPTVTVDMGAIRFVCNGAKVLRPGIVAFDSFKKGDVVAVKDQTHGKLLAVGLALEDSETAKSMAKGYVVDNLHHVGDKVWEAAKEI